MGSRVMCSHNLWTIATSWNSQWVIFNMHAYIIASFISMVSILLCCTCHCHICRLAHALGYWMRMVYLELHLSRLWDIIIILIGWLDVWSYVTRLILMTMRTMIDATCSDNNMHPHTFLLPLEGLSMEIQLQKLIWGKKWPCKCIQFEFKPLHVPFTMETSLVLGEMAQSSANASHQKTPSNYKGC